MFDSCGFRVLQACGLKLRQSIYREGFETRTSDDCSVSSFVSPSTTAILIMGEGYCSKRVRLAWVKEDAISCPHVFSECQLGDLCDGHKAGGVRQEWQCDIVFVMIGTIYVIGGGKLDHIGG